MRTAAEVIPGLYVRKAVVAERIKFKIKKKGIYLLYTLKRIKNLCQLCDDRELLEE